MMSRTNSSLGGIGSIGGLCIAGREDISAIASSVMTYPQPFVVMVSPVRWEESRSPDFDPEPRRRGHSGPALDSFILVTIPSHRLDTKSWALSPHRHKGKQAKSNHFLLDCRNTTPPSNPAIRSSECPPLSRSGRSFETRK